MAEEYKKRLDRIEDFCKQIQSEWHKYLALQSTDIIMRQIIGMTKGAYNETNTITNRPSTESVDKPIEVRCPACGCPVVEHRLFEYGALAGEHIDCACGYVYRWGKEG